MAESLHHDLTVVDGLEIAAWGPDVFRAQHAAGLAAVNCTCCVWEGFEATMANVARFRGWLDEHADLLRTVRGVDDIRAAKREQRVGIILGWQNVTGIGDRIDRLSLFKELGVGIIQLAYNTQNLVGAGCYEATDPGLSGFGHEVLAEMNRVGIVADLSHVGARTTHDTIVSSQAPVVFSHVCLAALEPHPRNKTDDEMRAVAERGGLVGVTCFPWFLRAGREATIDDYVDAIEHTVNVVGEDHAGVGTDFIDGHGAGFLEWLLLDKGYARPLVSEPLAELTEDLRMPTGIGEIAELPNLTADARRARERSAPAETPPHVEIGVPRVAQRARRRAAAAEAERAGAGRS